MKLTIIAAIAVLSLQAQPAAKVETPTPTKESAKPTELPFSETEVLKLRLAGQDIQRANKVHDIQGYQKEILEPQQISGSIIIKACEALGITPEKIQIECGVATGFDDNDKPIVDPQSGKPIVPRVYKIQAAPMQATPSVPTPPTGSK